MLLAIQNFDQKGRLYRHVQMHFVFYPDQGIFCPNQVQSADHVDTHSMFSDLTDCPFAYWLTREDVSVGKLFRMGR